MRYIIHIGTHKTGTSSIQTFLTRNRKKLLKQGIYYPVNKTGSKNFNFLASQIAFENYGAVKRFFKTASIEAEKKNAHTIVISAESFYAMTAFFKGLYDRPFDEYWENERIAIETFRDILPSSNVDIISYFRRPDLFLESMYNQAVKHPLGFTETIDSFYTKMQEMLNYYRHIKLWADSFGTQNISIKNFQTSVKSGLIESFLSELGIPSSMSFLPNQKYANERLQRDVLEYKRLINRQKMLPYQDVMAMRILCTISEEINDDGMYQGYLTDDERLNVIEDGLESIKNIADLLSNSPRTLYPPYEKSSGLSDFYPGLSLEKKSDIQRRYNRLARTPQFTVERFLRFGAFHIKKSFLGNKLIDRIRKIRVAISGPI